MGARWGGATLGCSRHGLRFNVGNILELCELTNDQDNEAYKVEYRLIVGVARW